jgi:hypothetical protein
MSAPNGVARRAFQQAGLHVQSEPRLITDPVPVEDTLPIVRDPAATERSVAITSTPTPMRLHVDLLASMALVGFGLVLGYGTAMVVAWLNGSG